jgi:hypothetical protein
MKRLSVFLIALLFIAAVSYAQEITGEILGKVTLAEDGTPLPGVTVTLTGQTYGVNTFITTKEGNFRFWKLTPGNYDLKFELQGFKTVIRQAIRVNVLGSAAVNVTMEPGGIEEQVTVIGEVPLINTRKASVSASYTSDSVTSLPVARRTSEIVNLAPGIMTPHPMIAGQGSAVAHGFGVRHLRGEYSLDGASYRSTYGAGGMPAGVNTARVEETQVTTSGQDISNVQGGATINFVTKRGGNKLAGDAYLAYMATAMQSDKSLPVSMGPKPATGADPAITYLGYTKRSGVYRTYDYGVSLGGPVLKDHLWFFGSWAVIDPISQNYYGVPSSRYYNPDMYGKVNFQWGKTTAEVSFAHVDNMALNDQWFSNSPNNLDRLNPADTFTAQATQTIWSKLLVSAKFTFFHTKTQTHQANFVWTGKGDVSYDDGRTYNPPGRYYVFNYFKSPPYNTEANGHWQHYGDQQKRPYLVVEGNFFAESLLGGDHEFKFGFDRNYARFIEEYMAPNQSFIDILPASQSTSDIYNAPSGSGANWYWGRLRTYCDRYGEKRSERTGIYFQDIMTYGRLTATIGARIDWHAWAWEPVTYHGLSPADQPVTGWDQWTGPVTVDGGSLSLNPAFSPRITLSYDLTGKGKDLIKLMFASYGGALDNLGFRAGFKKGNTRGEFTMPFYDTNNNMALDWNSSELYWLNLLGRWPSPNDILMMIAKGQAEKPVLEAIYGVGKVPWNKYTYPGWFYMGFSGNPLGNKAPGRDPIDFLADDFEPERVTELLLSYEKMIGSDISIQVLGAYKKEYNLPWLRGYYGTISNFTLMPINTAIKVGTDPTTGWDMYQRDPKIANPIGYMMTNYKDTYSNFRGLQFIFTKKLSHKWMGQVSLDLQDWRYHASRAELGDSTLFDYYNDAPYQAYQYRSTEPGQNARWHFKISGLYQLPLGIHLSGFVDAREGYPVNGKWITAYLGQALPAKSDKYGDYRMPTLWYANLTLEKTFIFSENVSSTVYITGYNVTDNLITTMINEAKVPTTINQPSDVTKPRVFQVGIRFSFR